MSKLYKCSFIGMMVLAVAFFLTACSGTRQPSHPKPVKLLLNRPPTRPITSIRVGIFQCDNEVTGQAARNVFMEMLARYGDVKVVQDGEADVVIEGTVTLASVDSSSGNLRGGPSFISGKGQRVAATYVSGVTSLAMRDGGVLTSASWGQSLEKGSTLLPPEAVARNAADRLLGQLAREGLKKR